MAQGRQLDPPKGAYWFMVQRENDPGEWETIIVDGRDHWRVDGAPSIEQVAEADATARGKRGTYRAEWRQKNRNLRKLGYCVAFSMGPAAPIDDPDESDDESDDDQDDEDEREPEQERRPPSPPPRKQRTVNPNGNGSPYGSPYPVQPAVQLSHLVGASRPPAAYGHDPHMFSFQAFDYLKHALDRDAERAESERARRDQRDREFTAMIVGAMQGQAKENTATMHAFFERMMDLQRETSEHATRAAVAEATSDEGVSDALVEQLAQIKAELAGMKEHEGVVINADGEAVDMQALWNVLTGVARVVGNTQWAQKNLPELARMFAGGGAVPPLS